MPENISLEVPATLSALSTVRMVLGGLGARLDFSLEDLDDLFLATDSLLEAALEAEPLDSLRVQMTVDGVTLRVVTGSFHSDALRAQVAITPGRLHRSLHAAAATRRRRRRRGGGRQLQRRHRQAQLRSRRVSARDDRRVNDPLDLEALPGQARTVRDEDEEGEASEQAPHGPSADPEGRGRDDSEKLDQYLLRRYHLHGDRRAREQLITMYLPLVRSLARRYASRGEQFDDLVQVGAIGLIKAIDRFDLSRGVELTTYATPNIVGEIKRYFRDKGWSVRVPRGLQELNIRLNKVIDELVPKLQRSPTISELAEAANATPEQVLEALETSQAYNSVSLQASPNGESGEEDAGLIDYLGGEEEAYDTMEDRTTLAPGFAKLDKRERYILHLRFFEGLTQSQIAERVGISQMHVSRLIRRSLEKLREEIGDLDTPHPPPPSDADR